MMFSLMMMILALIFLVLFIQFFNSFDESIKNKSSRDACMVSVVSNSILNAAYPLEGVEFANVINCPTKNITITKNVENFDKEIKKTVADSMYECWDMFGQGKTELFADDGIFCVICSIIEFKDNGKEISGFGNYLMQTSISGKEISYMDFLHGYETPNSIHTLESSDSDVLDSIENTRIDTDNLQSVIFVHAKGKEKIKVLSEAFDNFIEGEGTDFMVLGGTLVAAGFASSFTGVGAVIGVGGGLILAGGTIWNTVKTVFITETDAHASFVVLREYNTDVLNNMACEYYPSLQNTNQ